MAMADTGGCPSKKGPSSGLRTKSRSFKVREVSKRSRKSKVVPLSHTYIGDPLTRLSKEGDRAQRIIKVQRSSNSFSRGENPKVFRDRTTRLWRSSHWHSQPCSSQTSNTRDKDHRHMLRYMRCVSIRRCVHSHKVSFKTSGILVTNPS